MKKVFPILTSIILMSGCAQKTVDYTMPLQQPRQAVQQPSQKVDTLSNRVDILEKSKPDNSTSTPKVTGTACQYINGQYVNCVHTP